MEGGTDGIAVGILLPDMNNFVRHGVLIQMKFKKNKEQRSSILMGVMVAGFSGLLYTGLLGKFFSQEMRLQLRSQG